MKEIIFKKIQVKGSIETAFLSLKILWNDQSYIIENLLSLTVKNLLYTWIHINNKNRVKNVWKIKQKHQFKTICQIFTTKCRE